MKIGDTPLDRTPRDQIDEHRNNGGNNALLRDSVTTAVRGYLDQLDGQMGNDVYQMVLAEVEAPLLTQIMQYTRNNQTKASRMLGLNRGTLRKKLKQYGLLDNSGA